MTRFRRQPQASAVGDEFKSEAVPLATAPLCNQQVDTPPFNLDASASERWEMRLRQAHVAEATVEALDECILHGLPV